MANSDRRGSHDLYIELFWVPLIERIEKCKHIDVFLLFNCREEVDDWDVCQQYLKDNVLFDLIMPQKMVSMMPWILSK